MLYRYCETLKMLNLLSKAQSVFRNGSFKDFCKIVISQLYSHHFQHSCGCKNTGRVIVEIKIVYVEK